MFPHLTRRGLQRDQDSRLRAATPEDARAMTRLINIAGEGLPLHFWGMLAQTGEDPWAVGEHRARREEGSFSWRNAQVIEAGDSVASLLMTYPIGNDPEPVTDDTPTIFRPLAELENLALGTFYVNVLATEAAHRGKGYGSRLLRKAEEMANGRRLSIIVSDGNETAYRLYRNHGYVTIAQRPIVTTEEWRCGGENWVLMRTL